MGNAIKTLNIVNCVCCEDDDDEPDGVEIKPVCNINCCITVDDDSDDNE